MKDNIIFIGMPGVGKSTVGIVLAKKMGYGFVDSDLIIQEKEGRLLFEIIETEGVEGFWEIENRINQSIHVTHCIIATGGSAVYGTEAMEHFKKTGTIVYLVASYEELNNRLGDLNKRGVTLKPGQDLMTLLAERTPLYEKYADITISCDNKEIREIVEEIYNEQKKCTK